MNYSKVTVRVVETMSINSGVPFTTLCERTAEVMLDLTGGATIDAAGIGMWRDNDGRICKELGANIWTLCESVAQIESIKELAAALKVGGYQDCVLVTVETIGGDFL